MQKRVKIYEIIWNHLNCALTVLGIFEQSQWKTLYILSVNSVLLIYFLEELFYSE